MKAGKKKMKNAKKRPAKKGYLDSRLSTLSRSFAGVEWKAWMASFARDIAFLFACIFLSAYFILVTTHHLSGTRDIAERAIPLLATVSGGSPLDLSSERETIRDDIGRLVRDFLIISGIFLIIGTVLFSTWNYLAFSAIRQVKKHMAAWLMYCLQCLVWFVICIAVFMFTVYIFRGTAQFVMSGLVSILLIYMSIILFYVLLRKSWWSALKGSIMIGFKGVHKVGIAYAVSLLAFILLNMIMITVDPVPGLGWGLLISVIIVVFISWSRQYICLEIGEVLAHER